MEDLYQRENKRSQQRIFIEMKKYKKMDVDSLALEEFKLKEYFTELTLENALIKYLER